MPSASVPTPNGTEARPRDHVAGEVSGPQGEVAITRIRTASRSKATSLRHEIAPAIMQQTLNPQRGATSSRSTSPPLRGRALEQLSSLRPCAAEGA